jgi:ATP-GRASP peptide maturase of grasp-with-spasm system
MILIVSSETDQSTHKVCEWLDYKNVDFVVINETNPIVDIKVKIMSKGASFIELLLASGHIVTSERLKGIWYRRGSYFWYRYPKNTDSFVIDNCKREWDAVIKYLLNKFDGLSNFLNTDLNKLVVLEHARNVGLNIPKTLICSNKSKLYSSFAKSPIINKPITCGFNGEIEGSIYSTKTVLVEKENLSEDFFPSKFQLLIEKKFEVRVFYLDGLFYSMAIFSQLDDKTKIDFRNYNTSKPNRTVPFTLPAFVKEQLKELMQILRLDTGSIDLVVNLKNEFVFLEVNPIGQFGMVSFPCNYYLERKIANYLIKDK